MTTGTDEKGSKNSLDEIQSRVIAIAKMKDGTIHPGAIVALTKLVYHYGTDDLVKVEEKGFTFIDVWTLYSDECGQDIHAMHDRLNS